MTNVFNSQTRAEVVALADDFEVCDLDSAHWSAASALCVNRCWSGAKASAERHFEARLMWSQAWFYIGFCAVQNEPPVVADLPDTSAKAIGLWNRDVCEIFIAPDKFEPRRYFEFEVAPTGEWLDLAIDATGAERQTDWNYKSEMKAFARLEDGKFTAAIKIPWKAFGRAAPSPGDVWLGNIFRCVGGEPGRGYLAWQPTFTSEPRFHVPAKFGEFVFVEER